MFDDRMGEEGGTGGLKGPAALKYLLSKEKEKWKEEWREGGKERRKPSVKKQVGVMKEDNKFFLSGHVGQDLTHQSSWPVTTIRMTTRAVCVCLTVCVCVCVYIFTCMQAVFVVCVIVCRCHMLQYA